MLGKRSRGGSMLLTSARVGVGYSIIDCRRWEATMTGLPACLHLTTISFCTDGTSSSGICAPACISVSQWIDMPRRMLPAMKQGQQEWFRLQNIKEQWIEHG